MSADRNRADPPQWELRPAADHGLPLGQRLRSLSRERGLVDTLLGGLWWTTVRLYLRLYHRLLVEGAEHLPTAAPCVVVANHCSHLDALVVGSVLHRRLRQCMYPIAAGDTFFATSAVATFAAFVLNALPLWRRHTGRYALAQLRERLIDEPCGFVLFPEGTRSRSGAMAPFKPGLGMLIGGTPVPVIPCFLAGTHRAWPPGAVIPRPRQVRLVIGPPVQFAEIPHDKAGWRHIAAATEAAVRHLSPTS